MKKRFKKFKIATRYYLMQNITDKEGTYIQAYWKLDGPDKKLNQFLKKKLRKDTTWLIYNIKPVEVDVKWEDDSEIPKRPSTWYIPGRDYSLEEQYPLLAWSIMTVPKDKSKILILGGGPGREALLMKIFEPQRKIISVDINPEDLKYAKKAGINVCNMRMENLAFPDNSFDCVYSNNVYEHIYNNPNIIFKEIRRVLRLGGSHIFLIPLDANPSNPYYRLLEKVIKTKKDQFSEKDMRTIDPGHPWKTDLYDIQIRLNQTGFKEVQFIFFRPNFHLVNLLRTRVMRTYRFLKRFKTSRRRSNQVLVIAT